MIKLSASNIIRYLIIGIVSVFIATLWFNTKKPDDEKLSRDYDAIKKEGIIRVATEYNSLSFYTNGDTLLGFNYELIRLFAQQEKLEAKISPIMSYKQRLEGLKKGKFDIIAYGMQANDRLKDSLSLTQPIFLSKQILVQHKSDSQDSSHIHSQLQLAGKTLHVVKGSPAIQRIQNLGEEIGDTIYIKEINKYGPEQLMAMVAHGDIKYAVCDESIVLANLKSFPQLDINTDISFTQFYSWAVNKESPKLLEVLNNWLGKFTKSKEYQQLYRKYYNKNNKQ